MSSGVSYIYSIPTGGKFVDAIIQAGGGGAGSSSIAVGGDGVITGTKNYGFGGNGVIWIRAY